MTATQTTITPSETCQHPRWCCITPVQGPDATEGCFDCPETRKGHEIGVTRTAGVIGRLIDVSDPICRAQGYCPTNRRCSC